MRACKEAPAHEKAHCVYRAQWAFSCALWYTEAATALTKPIRQGREGVTMTIGDIVLSLLTSVLGSILGTLILQRLGR